jgi:branched-chain amino acid aminotransferase
MWIFLNDRFVTRDQALVSVFDHGFLYGDGVYETLRSYDGRIFMLRQHLSRLQRSAGLIGMELPIPEKDWPGLLHESMDRNQLRDAYLRITVSRGEGEIGLDPKLCPRPTVVIVAKPLPNYASHLFEHGVNVVVVSVRRNLSTALSPQIKSLNFLNNILAKQEASSRGAFDGILLNAQGFLTECTTSNLFFVRRGRLCTPSVEAGILDGITRDIVLQLAEQQGIPTETGLYQADVLRQADECFLTNTTMQIMPVSCVDGVAIGSGRPGPLTSRLGTLFQASIPRFLE